MAKFIKLKNESSEGLELLVYFGSERPLNQKGVFIPDKVPDGFILDSAQILFRHGQRQPSGSDLGLFKTLDEEVLKNIHHIKDHDTHKYLKTPLMEEFMPTEAEYLIRNGIVEHHTMGAWWRAAIDELPKDYYSKGFKRFFVDYHPAYGSIRSTHIERTSMSGMAFCHAFFRSHHDDDNYPVPVFFEMVDKDRDTLLRFFDLSEEYQHTVKKNHAIKDPFNAFCAKWIPPISEQVSKRMGCYPGWIPSVDSTLALWRAAIHHTIVLENYKSYYQLFTHDEAVILAYAFDLYHHSLQGPHFPISTSISSSFFDQVLLNEKEGKNGLYFAHEETVVPVCDALGLFTEKLTEHYDLHQIKNRKWQLSEIAPYSTNIGFLFYKNNEGKTLVVTMHKGDYVKLEGQHSEFCPLEDFRRIISQRVPLKEIPTQ